MGADEVLRAMLMYFIMPLWLAAGFADYLCHRAAHIEKTSGWTECVGRAFLGNHIRCDPAYDRIFDTS